MTPTEIKNTRVSIVVATYNRPDALKVCIRSIFGQTRLPDEIVIGDDGSGQATLDAVKELQSESPVPIVHVWHEDKGFRKAKMCNKSMARATGEYIIEIDGDVFLHPRFVEDHLSMASPGHYVKGGRTNLGPALTDDICRSERPRIIRPWTRGIDNKAENSIRFMPLARYLAPRYRRNRESAIGCNMSFYRADFLRINGYDEFYEGWGGEDWDFGKRLQQSGLTKRHLKFCGLVYHLWHDDKFMYNKDKNFERLYRYDNPVYCLDGVDKYLTDK